MAISQQTSHGIVVRRIFVPVALAAAVALTLAACSPASPTGKPAGTSGGATVATATFTGSESGKAVMNLCTGGDGSIFVTVDGTNTKLPGVVSKDNLTFDGEDSIYHIDKTGPLPQVSSDGNTFTLDGVILTSIIDPSKKLTFAGKVTCP